MKTLGWPLNFVAQCPVRLFEASGMSKSWLPSSTVGELHMRPLGNSVLHFQLRDMLDNQILFEYTMHKPASFMVLAHRFFAIRLENGSFRGFGFAEDAAASEMKKQVQNAVKPHHVQEPIGENFSSAFVTHATKDSLTNGQTLTIPAPTQKHSSVVAYESVPKRSSTKSCQISKEQEVPSASSFEPFTVCQTPKPSMLSKWRISWKGFTSLSFLKNWNVISVVFGLQEHEMEIGYPTDVKHVTHIGWDGPSVGGPSWIGELKPSADFASGPLREFGQPMGSDWIHDALSAAKWTTPGEHSGPPPGPPAEYLDSGTPLQHQKSSKWTAFRLWHKSRGSSSAIAQT